MTMLSPIDVSCAVCGQISEHRSIQSTNAFGSPDLDTRPPEMERSTIYYWMQKCPSCHYCASDISECDPKTKSLVATNDYLLVARSNDVPEDAAIFLAVSYLDQHRGSYSDAAWRAIHASWICDDKNHSEGAQSCRLQALELMGMVTEKGQVLSCQMGATETITVDLLRRTGQFEKALEYVEKAKVENLDEIILKILKYEEMLIGQQDSQTHTMAEALEDDDI